MTEFTNTVGGQRFIAKAEKHMATMNDMADRLTALADHMLNNKLPLDEGLEDNNFGQTLMKDILELDQSEERRAKAMEEYYIMLFNEDWDDDNPDNSDPKVFAVSRDEAHAKSLMETAKSTYKPRKAKLFRVVDG